MNKIKKYLTSDNGQAFKQGLLLCAYGVMALTFLVGATYQASTVLLTKVLMLGFVSGISNRMVPFGFALCMLILTIQKTKSIYQDYSQHLKHVAWAGVAFSLIGFVLGLVGL